jgi:hypothetical protein
MLIETFNLPLDLAVELLPNEDANTLGQYLQSQQGILGLSHHSDSMSHLQPARTQVTSLQNV